MFDILSYEFMQRALISGVLIAVICAILGVFLVLKRLSLLGDGLAHAAFAGVAVGLLVNVYPLISSLIFTSIGALGIQQLIKKIKIYGESATAIVLSVAMGIAVLIIGIVKGFNADLFSYLFGSILAVNITDLFIIGTVFLIVLAFISIFYKKLIFMSFNEDIARTSGIDVDKIDKIFVIITAMTVVVAIRAVGILLVSALLVMPAIIAFQLANSFRKTMMVAIAVALLSVLLGIFVSFYMDLAPGGTIVLVLFLIFIIVLALKKHIRHN